MNNFAARALRPDVLLTVVAPLVGYQVLHAAGASDLVALTAAAVFPVAAVVMTVVRTRRISPLGTLSLLFIGIGIATALVFQDPTLVLVASALPTGVVGLAFFATLLGRHPMTYLLGRELTGPAAPLPTSDGFRRRSRTMTAIWGAALVVSCAAHVVAALLLPPSVVVPLNLLITIVVVGPVVVHTVRARARRLALN